jgi:hypothetical protein
MGRYVQEALSTGCDFVVGHQLPHVVALQYLKRVLKGALSPLSVKKKSDRSDSCILIACYPQIYVKSCAVELNLSAQSTACGSSFIRLRHSGFKRTLTPHTHTHTQKYARELQKVSLDIFH